jgi:GABA permease
MGFLVASVGAVLAGGALIVVLVIEPPILGWVGFGVVAVIVLSLASLTPAAFERTRVSAPRPAEARDGEERLLVVADPLCSETLLCEAVLDRSSLGGVHVVVPLRVSPLHFLTDDEAAEGRQAEQSLAMSVGLLRQHGVPATGSVGTDKPLESMTDALGTFAATRVLLATPPGSESFWLERGLLEKARQLTPLPVEHVFVARPTVAPHGAARLGLDRTV